MLDAPLLIGVHALFDIFLAPGDHQVDEAGKLARGGGDGDGLSLRASRARCLAPMKVWLLRAPMAAIRRAAPPG